MKPEDFELIRDLLKTRSGLIVNPDKVYLLESRLTPVARRSGLSGLDELIDKIRLTKSESLIVEVTEAMTTNESFFFRDKTPFETFEKHVLPHILETRGAKKKLRIWLRNTMKVFLKWKNKSKHMMNFLKNIKFN